RRSFFSRLASRSELIGLHRSGISSFLSDPVPALGSVSRLMPSTEPSKTLTDYKRSTCLGEIAHLVVLAKIALARRGITLKWSIPQIESGRLRQGPGRPTW